MVTIIPRILTNKTRYSGLGALQHASIFKPVTAKLDLMGKVDTPTIDSSSFGKLDKPFVADSTIKVIYSPLKSPFAQPKRVFIERVGIDRYKLNSPFYIKLNELIYCYSGKRSSSKHLASMSARPYMYQYSTVFHGVVMQIITTKKFSVIDVGNEIQNHSRSNEPTNYGAKKHKDHVVSQKLPQQPKPQPQPKRYGIFLDIDEPYTRNLIRKAFQHPSREPYFEIILGPGVGWDPIPIPASCSFQWSEYERIDWYNGLLPPSPSTESANNHRRHGASSYFIRKGLSRKAQLAYYTHRHVCKYPDSILKAAIPQTIVLDCWSVWEDDTATTSNANPKIVAHQAGGLSDVVISIGSTMNSDSMNRRRRLDACLAEAKVAMENAEAAYEANTTTAPPVWILKGSTTNKGAGIFIVHLYEQVVDHCWTESDIREWVLQRYIPNPLLLRKRKFHIRAYVLAVSALRVYFYRNCLALCAGKQYSSSNHYTDLSAHITNTAYQIETDQSFQEKFCVLQWNESVIAPILVRDGTCPSIDHARVAIQSTIDKMGAITGELFNAYKGEFGVFSPLENCFEHYGLDFLVDDEWNVYLLEVNPGPDFKQTGNKLEKLIEDLMAATIDVALLPLVCGVDSFNCTYNDDAHLLRLVYEQCRTKSPQDQIKKI